MNFTTKLTPKQRKFVIAYAKTRNGSQSAVKAGYSKNSAEVTASKLLKKANIQNEIERLTKEADELIEAEAVASIIECKVALTKIIRQEFMEISETITENDDGSKSKIIYKRTPKASEVVKAVDSLSKINGWLNESQKQDLPTIIFCGEDELRD